MTFKVRSLTQQDNPILQVHEVSSISLPKMPDELRAALEPYLDQIEQSPEDMAMLCALYSRDPGSVLKHIGDVEAKGSGSFMQKFYVGYNHKSIADCGSIHLFVEGISMYDAEALLDTQLFKGQASSSRYIDMSEQKISYAVTGNIEFPKELHDSFIDLYTRVRQQVAVKLAQDRGDGMATKADLLKATDIARGWLPMCITTNVAWHTDLRVAKEHLERMLVHPVSSVRFLAAHIYDFLNEKYPTSFPQRRLDPIDTWSSNPREWPMSKEYFSQAFYRDELNLFIRQMGQIPSWAHLPSQDGRTYGLGVPTYLKNVAPLRLGGFLDIGGIRDLHRHRNMYLSVDYEGVNLQHLAEDLSLALAPANAMPRSEARPFFKHTIEPALFYMKNVKENLQIETIALLIDLQKWMEDAGLYDFERAIFMPMMTPLDTEILCSPWQYVYLQETRSSKTVHPTLRYYMAENQALLRQKISSSKYEAEGLDELRQEELLKGIPYAESFLRNIIIDHSESDYDKRARQDITKKTKVA